MKRVAASLLYVLLMGGVLLSSVNCAAPRPPDANSQPFSGPTEATEVVALGNDWWAFSLEDGGRKRRFLYRNFYDRTVLERLD